LILKPLYKILSTTTDWSTFFSHANTLAKHEKGELFEKLTELVLLSKPAYKTRYKNVWLLRNGVDSKLRAKLNLPNVDEGIDLIAESYNGSYCSIQCKFKGANESPTRKDIATFLDLSRNHCKNITEQILVHTGTNGIKKTALLPDSFTQIGLDFWSQLTEEDWLAIQLLVKGEKVTSAKRNPRPHQQEAIAASKQYFLNDKNTRGKLIMPCGTGKSLTAYWITQTLGSKATIIAVPSLATYKTILRRLD
jgi:predicted helicase